MKHARVSSAWRPVRARTAGRSPFGAISALVFNACMLILPLAGAAALLIIARDHLYAYEYSDAGARSIGQRVARLNGELIQLDFDRLRQWDDLVAMELMAGDINAARGFLLSGPGMLSGSSASLLARARNDSEAEVAALELLTPGTRARYESMVPLLSRRSASGASPARPPVSIGGQEDFELMARAVLAEPESDPLQFILTGFSLGLAGDFGPRAIEGAAALLTATRRPDYQQDFRAQAEALIDQSVSIETFRNTALTSAEGDAVATFTNIAAAFRAAANPQRTAQVRAFLESIGDMSAAVSVGSAADLLTHATALRDVPRLRLLAQAAGDRAAAAAKRLPRDGRLLSAARGDLTINRDLATALVGLGLALAGLLGILAFQAYQAGRGVWRRMQDDEYGGGGELVEIGANNWRPL